jgi:hypothetical protein
MGGRPFGVCWCGLSDHGPSVIPALAFDCAS